MNKIDNIRGLRLLDDVVQAVSDRTWKPIVQAISNKTTGFLLELSDVGKYIRINSDSDVTVTIPNIEFPIGAVVTFEQTGEGTITLSGSGTTLNGNTVSAGQYNIIQSIKVSNTEWTIIGGTTV